MYEILQNGSDIRGKAMGEDITLTPTAVAAIGKGFVRYLTEKRGKPSRIAVGNDSRLSAETLFLALASGIESEGVTVIYTGLSSTPAMFMSTVMAGHEYDAAIMITASHMPKDRNGLKFFTCDGGLEKSDISLILKYAGEAKVTVSENPQFERVDIMNDYSEHLCAVIRDKAGLGDKPLKGLKIIVDCGNGAGGFFETKVLQNLGADTSGSIYTDPDGSFPNHIPNPEDKTAMEHICNAVTNNHADIGIIFDTDVDRAAVVLSDGKEVNRNRLIALMSSILLRDGNDTIVTDSVTSSGLAEFIVKHGGTHRRFKRGYRNVINEAKRLDACLAIETSGHGALRENYYLDDGAYIAAVVLAEAAKAYAKGSTIDELISDLKEPKEALELRIRIDAENFIEYGEKVIAALTEKVNNDEGLSLAPDNFEGVRVNFDKAHGDGWLLLRLSLHDPVLPLNIESDSVGGVAVMEAWIRDFLGSYSELTIPNRG